VALAERQLGESQPRLASPTGTTLAFGAIYRPGSFVTHAGSVALGNGGSHVEPVAATPSDTRRCSPRWRAGGFDVELGAIGENSRLIALPVPGFRRPDAPIKITGLHNPCPPSLTPFGVLAHQGRRRKNGQAAETM
jgi:hypothetical protein